MTKTNIAIANSARLRCVGVSSASQNLLKAISRVAPFRSTVLITGKSGTGKELVAQQIHDWSPRVDQLFVPVDCASMTDELMASQLFGHVKGAFTSADRGSLGCFRAADKGTIFLDEIGELPLCLQAKLLRVIQERAVIPVGSHEPIPVDVRVVAATNRDLRQEVVAGRFREDLFYRLSVVTIHTVPLCERRDDIPVLANHFLKELEDQGHPRHGLTSGAKELLELYDWPGNVRELKNLLEQAALDAEDYWIGSETILRILSPATADFCQIPLSATTVVQHRPNIPRYPVTFASEDGPWPKLEELERRLIVQTLEHTYYNKSAAARLLDISRQALLRKIAKLGIAGLPPEGNR